MGSTRPGLPAPRRLRRRSLRATSLRSSDFQSTKKLLATGGAVEVIPRTHDPPEIKSPRRGPGVPAIVQKTSHADDASRASPTPGRGFRPETDPGRWQDRCGKRTVMTITRTLSPIAFVAVFALAAAPAYAGQRRSGGGHSGGSSRGGAVSRGGSSRDGGGSASRGGGQTRSAPVYRGSVARSTVRVAPRIVGSRGVLVGSSAYYRLYYRR